MISVSTAFQTSIQSSSRTVDAYIVMNGVTYAGADLVSLDYSIGVTSDRYFVGDANAGYLKATLQNVPQTLNVDGLAVEAFVGVELATGTFEYVKLGKFYVDESSRESNRLTLECFDKMIQLDVPYVPSEALSYPITPSAFIADVLSGHNYTISFPPILTVESIPLITGRTKRQMLGYVAALFGGFAYVDRINEHFKIKVPSKTPSTASVQTIAGDTYFAFQHGDTVNTITEVLFNNGNYTSQSGTNDGFTLRIDCPLSYPDISADILSVVTGTPMVNYRLDYISNPALELGDSVKIIEYLGETEQTFSLNIGTISVSYGQGLRGTLGGIGEGKSLNNNYTDVRNEKISAERIVGGYLGVGGYENSYTTIYLFGPDGQPAGQIDKDGILYTHEYQDTDVYGTATLKTIGIDSTYQFIGFEFKNSNMNPFNTIEDVASISDGGLGASKRINDGSSESLYQGDYSANKAFLVTSENGIQQSQLDLYSSSISISSKEFASISLRGDNANGAGEPGGAYVSLGVDGLSDRAIFSLIQTAGTDGTINANSYTGTLGNALALLAGSASGPLQLGTNGAVRLTITATGNVGIGTTAPDTALDVVGNIRASSRFISTVATGTAPLSVASTTVVPNLNADKVDGYDATDFLFAPIFIPDGADFNDYKTAGMYYCNLSGSSTTTPPTGARSMLNNPFSASASASMLAFSLLVEKHAGVKQTLSFFNTNDYRTYVRNFYNSNWGPWVQVLNEGGNAHKFADGTYTFTSPTAGTAVSSPTIVFPANRFAGATPKITVSVATSDPQSHLASFASLSSTGFVIRLYLATGASTASRTVHWRASAID